MAIHMNLFREIADLSHTASKCILIWAIHSNKSAEGISLLTQILYTLVFLSRYLDLLWVSVTFSLWNFVLKNFYIWSSLYILLLMLRLYPRTREREKAWRLAIYSSLGALVASPLVTLIFNKKDKVGPVAVLYTFSLALESVCILPLLLLLRQTTVPTVITSFYLLTLGSYRFFYILNWMVRATDKEDGFFDPISFIFGVIQTALYVDFAWVYWTRQRVKLRGGGVVDSDDLRKSWLVGGLLGRGGRGSMDAGAAGPDAFGDDEDDDDVEGQRRGGPDDAPNGNGNARTPTTANRWGRRGVSVSADDTLEEHEHARSSNRHQHPPGKKIPPPISIAAAEGGTPQERAGMLKQPDDFLDVDDDDDDDDDDNEVGGMEDAQPFSVGDGDAGEDVLTSTTSGSRSGSGQQQQQVVLNSEGAWGEGGGGGGGGRGRGIGSGRGGGALQL